MKKLLTMVITVLILALMLSFVGCGKQAASSVELVINAPASSQAAIPVKEPAPTPAPVPSPSSVSESSEAETPAPVESTANSTEKVDHTPATAGLPVLPVLGILLVACLYGLVREMRKKY